MPWDLSGINPLAVTCVRVSTQVQLLPHLGCHCCLSGRKFTAQGLPANCFFSDGEVDIVCRHGAAWSHLALQMRCGRKELLTALRDLTVCQGEGSTFLMGHWQTSQTLTSVIYHCSGTKGQVSKFSPPFTPSKTRDSHHLALRKTLICSGKTRDIQDRAFPSPAWRCELGLLQVKIVIKERISLKVRCLILS